MTKPDLPLSLSGLAVGFSGAVPERKYWTEVAQDRGILEFVALLSGLVLKYGGSVVHGAHPTFTPVILRQAQQQAPSRKNKAVTICMSQLWAKLLPAYDRERFERESEFVVVSQVGEGDSNDSTVRNASLSAMRRTLVNRMNVLVAVGGMRHEGTGLTPGVAEEVELARQRGIACFVVGGLGGEAAKVAERFKLDTTELRNGMSVDKNAELLSSDDISGCVGIIFEHLANHRHALLHGPTEGRD
ncbi:MAG: hypothetical protein JWR69_4630 [Pedosphaera sp.]|nr:hypothetical protein [Pedosphaera sp.]